MSQASTVGRLFTADREVTGCGTTFLPHRTGFPGELLPCYERARDAVSWARPHSKDPLMFNVSVRKIVVSTVAIAAPIAFSFGASSEAWGGKSVEWGKNTGSHTAKVKSVE